MLDDLLAAGKISPQQYDTFLLFHTNEIGYKYLQNIIMAEFMSEPREKEFNSEGFAFYSGRQSVWRDIQNLIQIVQQEIDNVGRNEHQSS